MQGDQRANPRPGDTEAFSDEGSRWNTVGAADRAASSQHRSRPHAAVVYNPVKISIDHLRAAVEAERQRRSWAPTRWYPTDRDDSGMRAAQEALEAGPEVVIVAGGDGTLRAVAEILQGTEIPLAILPCGTGNLLARNLGIPLKDIPSVIRNAFAGSAQSIDIATATLQRAGGAREQHVFLVMAGIGLDAEMAEHTSATAKKHLGWVAYVQPITRSVLANRHFSLRYRIDGGPARTTRAHTVIIGNCGTLAGHMLLLPAAVVDDGLLDVVMLRPETLFGWARIGTRLTAQGVARFSKFAKHLLKRAPKMRALVYARGRQFDVRFDTPHTVQLDGDGFGAIIGARITVLPAALRICIPIPNQAFDPGAGGEAQNAGPALLDAA